MPAHLGGFRGNKTEAWRMIGFQEATAESPPPLADMWMLERFLCGFPFCLQFSNTGIGIKKMIENHG